MQTDIACISLRETVYFLSGVQQPNSMLFFHNLLRNMNSSLPSIKWRNVALASGDKEKEEEEELAMEMKLH